MTPTGQAELWYRADIDGLRAIAVLSVIGFHAFPGYVPSGFTGVDIFFVISGYLIAGLIVHGLRSDTFSFVDFYARRIRRLFPALILVLLGVWLFGWFTLSPWDFQVLGKQIVAGAGFIANLLTYTEVGYFDAPANTKPLLHLWSLGVEEQFYLVFPAVLVIAWRLGHPRATLIVLCALSFTANIVMMTRDPAFAFYMPMTRFWEFSAGALLANLSVRSQVWSQSWWAPTAQEHERWRDTASTVGLGLIAASFFVVDARYFPGWHALLPVTGSVLVIWAGASAQLNRVLLANPVLVFIGLISYALYLWHWPLLVMTRAYLLDTGQPSTRWITLSVLAASFLLACLSYRFVEKPVRAQRPIVLGRRVAAGAAICIIACAVLGYATAKSHGFILRFPLDVRALLSQVPDEEGHRPKLDSPHKTGPLVVPYGDSHAGHLLTGLRHLQDQRTFRLLPANWWICPPAAEIEKTPAQEAKCREIMENNRKWFEGTQPEIVVLATSWLRFKRIDRLPETFDLLKKAGVQRVVVVGPVPDWQPDLPQRLIYRNYRMNYMGIIPERISLAGHTKMFDMDRDLAAVARKAGVPYISALSKLCNAAGCLIRIGPTAADIMQSDPTHFTPNGSKHFVGMIADEIFGDH